MGNYKLDTPWKIHMHVFFAGILPLLNIATDLIIIWDYFMSYNDTYIFGVFGIAALALTTIGRVTKALATRNEEMCPLKSRILGILLHVSQLHPAYNIWTDIRRKERGDGSNTAMTVEVWAGSIFSILINLRFLLSHQKWSEWPIESAKHMDRKTISIFLSLAVALASLVHGALAVTIIHTPRSSGVMELYKSWKEKTFMLIHFLFTALLSLSSYALFWASFGAWVWAVLLPVALIVRPLAFNMFLNENCNISSTLSIALLVSPLWIFLEIPTLLTFVPDGNPVNATLPIFEAWLMIILCIYVPSSDLRDTALYSTEISPLQTLLENGLIPIMVGVTGIKALAGCLVYSHWTQAHSGGGSDDRTEASEESDERSLEAPEAADEPEEEARNLGEQSEDSKRAAKEFEEDTRLGEQAPESTGRSVAEAMQDLDLESV